MLKFTGAVCVLAGVILFCLTRWREQARRREILSDLSAGFYRLSDEIRATRKPLGILLARLAADSGPDAAEFFQIVSGAADAGENNNNFPAVWRDASENLLSEPRDRKRLIICAGTRNKSGARCRRRADIFQSVWRNWKNPRGTITAKSRRWRCPAGRF